MTTPDDPAQGGALGPGEHLDMGGGSVLSLLLTAHQTRGRLTVVGGVVTSGGPPLHVHQAEDELVVCLAGELAYQVGEERGTLAPGAVAWLPRQVPHTVAALGGRPCRFLTVVTPGGIEHFFRAQRDHLAGLGGGTPRADELARVAGGDLRPVVGPPLTSS